MALESKKIEMSFIYRDWEDAHPDVISIVKGFNDMLAGLSAEMGHNIDDIKFKIESYTDCKLNPL